MQEPLVRDVNVPNYFVLDTAALVPYYLRDTVLRLAAYDVFAPVLSDAILEELKGALRKLGRSHAHIERVVGAIERTFSDTIWNRDVLETHMREARGYVSDPDDAHVVSAALASGAHAIVTVNRRHFRDSALHDLGIEVWRPSELIQWSWARERRRVAEEALRRQCEGYENPPLRRAEVACKVDPILNEPATGLCCRRS